jgi:hypothetical protein
MMEAYMLRDGDDAGHCSNGLSAQNYRGATPEDRSTYRRWIFGMVVFYGALLVISGVVATAVDVAPRLTQLTTLSFHATPGPARPH